MTLSQQYAVLKNFVSPIVELPYLRTLQVQSSIEIQVQTNVSLCPWVNGVEH